MKTPLPLLSVRVREHEPGPVVMGPATAAAALHAVLPFDREGFACLHLNARHAILAVELVSVGALNHAIIHPREVLKGAILNNSHALIVGHNHPSGNTDPSQEDLTVTNRLRQCAELMGLELLDSMIVARNGQKLTKWLSLRESEHWPLQHRAFS